MAVPQPAVCRPGIAGRETAPLELASRQSQARLHPLEQGALVITNATAELDKRWALAFPPCLTQPRRAKAQKFGCLRWGQQTVSPIEIRCRVAIGCVQRPGTV